MIQDWKASEVMDIFWWQNVGQLSNHVELIIDVKSSKDLNRNVTGKWHCIEQDLAVLLLCNWVGGIAKYWQSQCIYSQR